jgi:four helix bundle protein
MSKEKPYEKLAVWQKADELAYRIYVRTKEFPREETYGITSQIRRAALSIPTNIAEGCGRQGKQEFKQFINIALGSLFETEYLLKFCNRLGYFSDKDYQELESLRDEAGALLWKLHKSLVL